MDIFSKRSKRSGNLESPDTLIGVGGETGSGAAVKGDRDRLGGTVRLALFVFAIAAVGYLAVAGVVANRVYNYLVMNANIALASRDVKNGILEMTDSQKAFFKTLEQDQLDRHEHALVSTKEALDRMANNPRSSDEDKQTIGGIREQVEQYAGLFTTAVDKAKTVGLTGEEGISGESRKAGMELTELNKQVNSPVVEAALWAARGDAKDFVIFERSSFLDSMDNRIKTLKSAIGSAPNVDSKLRLSMIDAADRYHKAMRQYGVAIEERNAALESAKERAETAQYSLPDFAVRAVERRDQQLNIIGSILLVSTILLVSVFAGLGWLLRRAQKEAARTLAEREGARAKAEAENEQLNDSVVSILHAVNSLSQRDLTVRAPVTQDVIGTVSDSINLLTDETSKVLRGVTSIAGQVERVSATVKEQADKVTQTAENERKSVSQMMESLFLATQTMNQVAALAEQSNTSAEQATVVTDNALGTVNATVKGMDSIRETIAETEKRIKRLGERSQEISGIVNLINTISERTHVLALNASMQAAVAGEAGRGFAVVAEEVQRLAESSRNATQQIGTLVSNIQLETNETISTVNRTIGQVVQGSEQAQKAGEQMRRTQEITAQLVGHVRSIANASEQQKSMSAQLLESVQKIGESTEQTAEQIEAQNKETDTLLNASRQLVESVRVFKLPVAA